MTLRYKLRTLLILLAILPPLLWFGWTKYEAWKAEQERQKALAAQRQRLDGLVLEFIWTQPHADLPAFFRDAQRAAESPVDPESEERK
jgi:hypothetical protein